MLLIYFSIYSISTLFIKQILRCAQNDSETQILRCAQNDRLFIQNNKLCAQNDSEIVSLSS